MVRATEIVEGLVATFVPSTLPTTTRSLSKNPGFGLGDEKESSKMRRGDAR